MKKQNFKCNIIIFISLPFLTGCWDQAEIEELAYVVALGIEKAEEEGIKVTFLITNPETSSQQGTNEPPQEIISFSVNDFVSARAIANTVIAKQITYDLLRSIIISEEFARDNDMIRWLYDAAKSIEIRRDLKFMITKESTLDFITNNKPTLETRPHKYLELVYNRGIETGTIPPSRLIEYFRITETDASLFLGIYATTEKVEKKNGKHQQDQITAGEFHYEGETNSTQFVGSAVFKAGKMIDTLTIEETRLSILLSNVLEQPNTIITSMPDPFNDEYQIATRITREKATSVKLDLQKQKPSIDITVPIVFDLLTNHSMTNYATDKDKLTQLETSFQRTMEQKFKTLIKKTQEEYGAEPFGWSLIARRHFLTLPEYEAFDWMKNYPNMEIDVKVDGRIGGFGRQIRYPDLKEVRD